MAITPLRMILWITDSNRPQQTSPDFGKFYYLNDICLLAGARGYGNPLSSPPWSTALPVRGLHRLRGLRACVMKQLRSIAASPVHITRETNQAVCKRIGVKPLIYMIEHTIKGGPAFEGTATSLAAFLRIHSGFCCYSSNNLQALSSVAMPIPGIQPDILCQILWQDVYEYGSFDFSYQAIPRWC